MNVLESLRWLGFWIAIVAALWSIWASWDAARDLKTVWRYRLNGGRRRFLVAVSSLVREIVRLITLGIIAAILGLLLPPMWVYPLLAVIAILIAVLSLIDRAVRHHLNHTLSYEEGN